MGKKLKQQRDSVKINRLNILEKRGGACEQHPAFSYQHLTTNKEYNFEYFKDKNERMRAQSIEFLVLEKNHARYYLLLGMILRITRIIMENKKGDSLS